MSSQRDITSSLSPFNKEWLPLFSKDRNPDEDDAPWPERFLKITGMQPSDELKAFMAFDGQLRSYQVEDVMRFCRRILSPYLASTTRRSAWLDDRSCSGYHSSLQSPRQVAPFVQVHRQYDLPLTATKLYDHLKEKRFNNEDLPNADRRYISDLNSHYIKSLVNSSSSHQMTTVRDTLWKHITMQTSLRVAIPPKCYTVFHFELHIPYYALRTHEPTRNHIKERTSRACINLSFLAQDFPGAHQDRNLWLYEAHVSIAICGPSENRWVAYCFEDYAFDPDREDFRDDAINLDPIASSEDLFDANKPIWNPRTYFIFACRSRIGQIRSEWVGLLATIEMIIRSHTDGDFSFPKASGPSLKENEEIIQMLEWTLKALRLIRRFLENIKKTNVTLDDFLSSHGDIKFFSNLDSYTDKEREQSQLCFIDIQNTFRSLRDIQQRLEDLETRLMSLEQQCQASAQVLQLRLSLEASKATKINGAMSILMVVAVSPVAIVSAFFAVPQPVFGFERNTLSFVISVVMVTLALQLLFVVGAGQYRKQLWWKNASERMNVARADILEFTAAAWRRIEAGLDSSNQSV